MLRGDKYSERHYKERQLGLQLKEREIAEQLGRIELTFIVVVAHLESGFANMIAHNYNMYLTCTLIASC